MKLRTAGWIGALALATGPALAAGYGYDPAVRDAKPGNVYFGVARQQSPRGHLAGVTIVLETATVNFITVTDERGRFRLKLPVEVRPADVKVRCSRPGYRVQRVDRRNPKAGELGPVQVDCYLQP